MNKDDIKTKQDAIQKGEDQDQDGVANPVKTKKIKARGLIQDSSDDDDDEDNLIVDESNNEAKSEEGRHLTFSFEFIFNNRILKSNIKDMSSRLVSFDGHPRDR